MTTEAGQAKGLQQTLKGCGFDICRMCVKCFPFCSLKNDNCCMAWLLSKQDDFRLQKSLLKQKFKARGTSVFSFPSFTASSILLRWYGLFYFILILSTNINYSTGDGPNIGIKICTKQDLIKWRKPYANALTCMLSSGSSTALGISWMPTDKVW